MAGPDPISNEELQAFIDGELNKERAAEIAARAQADQQLAAKIDAYRADKARIKELYGPLLEQDVPEEWVHMVREQTGSPARSRPYIGMALAASIAAAVLGWASLAVFTKPAEENIVAEALDAWPAPAQPSTPPLDITIASKTLSGALGINIYAPDLSEMDYTLRDVRVHEDTPAGNAVSLQYSNEANQVFSIYVRRSHGNVRFEMTKQGPLRICVWQDDVVGAVMLGELPAAKMLRLASLAYTEFNSPL